jgi:DNA-binding MarR family transcriptional regulator
METSGYARLARHEPGVIAERLGIAAEQEARALELLEAAHLVRRDGDRYGDIRPLTVSTRGGQEALQRLKRHWALVAADRALAPRVGDLFAYNVISVSPQDLERIRELLHAAFRELRSIVAASEPADQVALINLHLVGWNGVQQE